MKVITEERLKEIYEDIANSGVRVVLYMLMQECKETLTVSNLRPMREARDEEDAYDKRILVSYVDYPGVFHVVEQNGSNYWSDGEDDYHSDSEFIGWIPLPIYKPEEIK